MSDAQAQMASRQPAVRVLVVDDSAVTREVLTALLNSDAEINVIGQAATGAEAVELTATLRPDLVTMDLMMPGMDGMEATRRIMARNPTPVLFLSSFFDKEGTYSRADAIAAGALDVVEKPALMPDWRWHNAAGKLVQKVKSLAKVPVIAHIHGARKLLAAGSVAGGDLYRPGRRRRRDRRVFRRPARYRSAALGSAVDLRSWHRRRTAHVRRIHDEHAEMAA
jgi:chemotaxis response regulator CheB